MRRRRSTRRSEPPPTSPEGPDGGPRRRAGQERCASRPKRVFAGRAPGGTRTPSLLIRSQAGVNAVRHAQGCERCATRQTLLEGVRGSPRSSHRRARKPPSQCPAAASWARVVDAIDSLPLGEFAESAAFPLDETATWELCSIRPGKRCSMHSPADRSAVPPCSPSLSIQM